MFSTPVQGLCSAVVSIENAMRESGQLPSCVWWRARGCGKRGRSGCPGWPWGSRILRGYGDSGTFRWNHLQRERFQRGKCPPERVRAQVCLLGTLAHSLTRSLTSDILCRKKSRLDPPTMITRALLVIALLASLAHAQCIVLTTAFPFQTAGPGGSRGSGGSRRRCLCYLVRDGFVNPRIIQDIQVYPPSHSCNQMEIVVTNKNGKQYCLDPKVKKVQELIRHLQSKRGQ